MDAWFEEDEQVFVHPRDPYTRVDTVHSSRHVRVEIEGVTLGETRRPILLFETGLPTRYYIPKLDVRMDLLEPSESATRCPYKGLACYWSARVGDKLIKDIVWSYPAPIPECPKIENLLSFYNEHVDLYVDGVLSTAKSSGFSKRATMPNGLLRPGIRECGIATPEPTPVDPSSSRFRISAETTCGSSATSPAPCTHDS